MQPDSSSSAHPRGAAAASSKDYLVVARRYRPQSFQELIGQNQVAVGLTNAITQNRVGHAYLFTGARGVGKTSTARIFAKALVCEKGPTPTPCNQCDICQSIAGGDDVDVLEIDGASNRGIDEIRQLRSNVNIRPSRARFKIYIIDEVHMLTPPAFNALLKTLEEPPEHVKFIFCTTDPEKIPITVLSRCQRFDFAPVEKNEILGRLKEIAASEGMNAEPAALEMIARRANGSMRDSQSLLEQLLSFASGEIRAEDVHRMLGIARSGRVAALAKRLIARDAAGSLAELDAAVAEGVDIGQLAEQLLGHFRDMMASIVGCSDELLLHVQGEEASDLRQLAATAGLETTLAAMQILDAAATRLRHSPHSRAIVEMACVRICRLADLEQLAGLIAHFQTNPGQVSAPPAGDVKKKTDPGGDSLSQNFAALVARRNDPPAPAPQVVAPPHQAKTPRDSSLAESPASEAAVRHKQLASTAPQTAQVAAEDSENGESAGQVSEGFAATSADFTLVEANEWWRQAMSDLGDMTGDAGSFYSRLAILAPNRLAVFFTEAYNTQKEMCARPERKLRLEQALSRVAGRPFQLEFRIAPGEGAVVQRSAPATRLQRMRERQRHPFVREAMQMFDADITRVD